MEKLMGKYIEKELRNGINVIMSFERPKEEELGLDLFTLDEIMEVKEIDGIKVYIVYI